MSKTQQETPDRPSMPDQVVRELRLKAISEKLAELAEAFGYYLYNEDNSRGVGAPHFTLAHCGHTPNTVEAYGAILNLLAVVIGTAVEMGLHIEPGWAEVHPSHSPARLKEIVDAQTAYAESHARQLLLETL